MTFHTLTKTYWKIYVGVEPKIRGVKPPKMDGENHGTPYCLMNDFGKTHYFWKHPHGPQMFECSWHWISMVPKKGRLTFFLFVCDMC